MRIAPSQHRLRGRALALGLLAALCLLGVIVLALRSPIADRVSVVHDAAPEERAPGRSPTESQLGQERELAPSVIDRAAVAIQAPEVAASSAGPAALEKLPDITGRVVDSAGDPIPGAAVLATVDLWSGYDRWETDDVDEEVVDRTTTDAAGSFRLRPQLRSFVTVTASVEGRPPQSAAGCLPGAELKLVLSMGATLTGAVTVKETSAPVAGATVRIHHGAEGEATDIVETDAAGRYRAEGLVPGEGGVLVVTERYAMPRFTSAVLRADETTTVDVEVESGWALAGRVRDAATGDPIAGAVVSPWNFIGQNVTSDEQGFYSVEGARMRPGTLAFDAPGYGRTEVRFHRPSTELDVELSRARQVTGSVTDAGGVPIVGAMVVVVGLKREGLMSRREWSATRTDGEGRFRVDELRADIALTLQARAPGFGAAVVDLPEAPRPGQEDDLGAISLDAQAILDGRVLDGNGSAVLDARIELTGPLEFEFRDNLAFYFGRVIQSAREDGEFTIPGLSGGTWQLRAYEPAGRDVQLEIELQAGEERRDLVVQLPSGTTLSGRVRDVEGRAIEGAFIRLHPEEGQGGPLLAAECDAAGEFQIDDVPKGAFTAMIGGPFPVNSDGGQDGEAFADYIPKILPGVRADGSFLEATLDRLDKAISGQVVDSAGEPVENALVSVKVSFGDVSLPWSGVLTDKSGSFDLKVRSTAATQIVVWRTAPLSPDKTPTGDEWSLGRDILDEDGVAGRGTASTGAAKVRIVVD